MSIPVLMPALSPTMTEGKLAKWHVKVGDVVKSGQVICEIETDKATMEVEAVDEGTVAQILVEEGTEGVAVNTPICVLAAEGESVADAAKSAPAAAPAAPKAAPPPPLHPLPRRPLYRPPPRRRLHPRRPQSPNGRARPTTSRCARRCATPWPRRCARTARSS